MSDLIDDPAPGQNAPEYSVTEISGAVKRTVEGAFSRVRVRGEVGRVMHARSGHYYFDLKDDRAVISAVAWKGVAARLRTLPEEGMEVIATGKISTFGGQSKYQLIVDDVAPAGLGALMVMLEKRRKMFEAEGLFAPERKRPIPYLPRVIGVVTSPTGAVIRDILHRLRERFPTPVLLWPVLVQGERSAAEVAQAIRGFDALVPGGAIPRPDLLIVARGGGAIEDLWGFNEEVVVRAVADCSIPVISAVGHETDTTLIDHVADRRAPTPTAAAEMAVPVRVDLLGALAGLEDRRIKAMARRLGEQTQRLRDLSRLLPRPEAILSERMQRLDTASENLPRALTTFTQRRRIELGQGAGRFGPGLLRGYLRDHRRALAREGESLMPGLARAVARTRDRLAERTRLLSPQGLARRIGPERQALDHLATRLRPILPERLHRLGEKLTAIERIRASLGYEETLNRGYAIVRDGAGAVLPDLAHAAAHAHLEIEFRDGRLPVARDGSAATPAPPAKSGPQKPRAKPARPAPPKNSDPQGSLF